MMDIQRYLLIGAIAVLSFMLLTEWVQFREEADAAQVVSQQTQQTLPTAATIGDEAASASSADDLPSSPEFKAAAAENLSSAELVRVSTDVLELTIDLNGGDIVYAALPKHYAAIDKPDQPFVLLETERLQYVAQSGLVGRNATDTADGRPRFAASADSYSLKSGADSLEVDLHYAYSDSVDLIKRYRFHRGQYLVELEYLVDNRSSQPWQAALFTQLKRDNSEDPAVNGGGMGMQPFLGVAYRTAEDPFEKLDFEDMRDKPLNLTMNGGWIAMVQHYFVAAWIPDANAENKFSTVVTRAGHNIARATSAPVTVAPGTQGVIRAGFYAGPKDQYALEEISPGLELSVDYGWLWWIAQPLFWLLNFFYSYVGNWGWAIVLVTVMVKAVFFHLNATAFRSMANMRRVQPKLLELRERYGDDRAKQSQAMMELYKKEKINPLGGCLPMLVQMPVFIALYWVLMESVELRHAPFFGYIKDLSAMDPYFILPAIMGISMFFQQKLNPPPPDPMQAKIMQWLPVIFTFFFLFFPAGLVLYWVVNNVLSIAQQYVITRSIEKAEAAAK